MNMQLSKNRIRCKRKDCITDLSNLLICMRGHRFREKKLLIDRRFGSGYLLCHPLVQPFRPEAEGLQLGVDELWKR